MTPAMGDSDSRLGRRFRVPYSFRGAKHEMDQAFRLASGERQIATGEIIVGGLGILPHAGIVLLTDERLCFLVHYLFRPDTGYELPRGSVVRIEHRGLPTLRFLRLEYRTVQGLGYVDLSAAANLQYPRLVGVSQVVCAAHLVKALREAWGEDAPAFAAS